MKGLPGNGCYMEILVAFHLGQAMHKCRKLGPIQLLSEPVPDLMSIGPLLVRNKIEIWIQIPKMFFSRKCIWNVVCQKAVHFILASIDHEESLRNDVLRAEEMLK